MKTICTLFTVVMAGTTSWVFSQPKFQHQTLDDKISIGYGLAIGDVDGDGKPDILLADKKQFVWYRNGDWKKFVMVENLTDFDNVCIAARDIDGDGKVEVAVGAQWNPGETSDSSKSGSVHYLVRPPSPTSLWRAVELHHEPTVHRMRWVKTGPGNFQLVVLPLHGRGNKNGEGDGVRIIAYEMPADLSQPWRTLEIDRSFHLTHNFDVVPNGAAEWIIVGGKEGTRTFAYDGKSWTPIGEGARISDQSFGEVRSASLGRQNAIAGIQPMHGNQLVVNNSSGRSVLTSEFNQGHALAAADLLGLGFDQLIAGWREANAENKVGIKIFFSSTGSDPQWKSSWIDDNGIACEDLQVADLDGDGKKDIIAAGRATHNLKIYWNKSY
jgi:hypothetical protein